MLDLKRLGLSGLMALLAAVLIGLTAPRTEAQFWPWWNGATGCGSGTSTYTGPGDVMAAAGASFSAFWGVRALNRSVADRCLPLFDVTNSTDGSKCATVNALTTGGPNLSSILPGCASTTPFFVLRFYEYASGASNNIVATPNSVNFPTYNVSCVGAFPCVGAIYGTTGAKFQSANTTTPATGKYFAYGVANNNLDPVAAGCIVVAETRSRNQMRAGFAVSGGNPRDINLTGGAGLGQWTTTTQNVFQVASANANGASSVISVDGVDQTQTAPGSTDTTAAVSEVFAIGASGTGICTFFEGGFTDNFQSDATLRGNLNTNAHSFYGF